VLVPEAVFGFTRSQDLVSQHFEVIRRSGSGAIVAASNVGSGRVYTVPQDKALFVASVWALFNVNDANQSCMAVGIGWVDIGEPWQGQYTAAISTASSQGSAAVGVQRSLGFGPQLVVPGGHDIFVTVQLSVVAAAGQGFTAGISGILTPRGNILQA
jgi:hypothetical protein